MSCKKHKRKTQNKTIINKELVSAIEDIKFEKIDFFDQEIIHVLSCIGFVSIFGETDEFENRKEIVQQLMYEFSENWVE